MYQRGKELRERFSVSERTYCKVRKTIADNPERYGKWRYECGLPIPQFTPEDAQILIEKRSTLCTE